MDALLDAITERRRGARFWLAAATVALLAAGGATALALHARGGGPSPCAGEARKLDGIWDAARRDAVHARFAATGAPVAEAAFTTSARTLDVYAAAWIARSEQLCRKPPVLADDPRRSCLEQLRRNLDGLVGALTTADRAVVQHAAEATRGLESLESCDDPSLFGAPEPHDPATREQVAALRARISAAEVLWRSGRLDEGLAALHEIATAAQTTGFRPVEAEAYLDLAVVHRLRDDLKAAEEALTRVVEAAEESRYDLAKARAWIELGFVLMYQLRYDEAHKVSRWADAAIKPFGEHAAKLRMQIEGNEAMILDGERRFDDALAMMKRALADADRLYEPDDVRRVSLLINLGVVLVDMGRPEEGDVEYKHALDVMVRTYGEDHPTVAKLLNNLGSSAYGRKDYATALAYYQRALPIKEKNLGPENPSVAYTLLGEGSSLRKLGRPEEALVPLARARAILEKNGGLKYALGDVLRDQAEIALDAGKPAGTAELLERAIVLYQEGKSAPEEIGRTRFDLARAMWAGDGDRSKARELAQQARAELAQGKDASAELSELDAWLAAH
jgi:tetratricopeptide (TPR) repeat protein